MSKSLPSYATWFELLAGSGPHPWQRRLGEAGECIDRLVRIPTGFGKTVGTVLAWAYHRVARGDDRWPTRLVFCLPMRTLVEQTESAVRSWVAKGKLDVGVHVLMGGTEPTNWHHSPECPAILIGTQDMLLSRALNRGYGEVPPRWPIDFGLLNTDCLWVLDEVQLMGAALATSTQLAALRRQFSVTHDVGRPARSWWMSATLQPSWLETVDFAASARELATDVLSIPKSERTGPLWKIRKELEHQPTIEKPEDVARLALASVEPEALTLVVVNTVERAIRVHEELLKRSMPARKEGARKGKAAAVVPGGASPDIRLIHSRFRGHERKRWMEDFLARSKAAPPEGRILVATQVVEAGVDISARTLITDLAPWSSLVQRFGRTARYAAEAGRVVVIGKAGDAKRSLPYTEEELKAAQTALGRLVKHQDDASVAALTRFEEGLADAQDELLAALYPYEPKHVLRRPDLLDLFDTSPDLGGAHIDVSRYIREGDERNVRVFWRRLAPDASELPVREIGPVDRDELCPAPVGQVQQLLREGARIWRRDYTRGKWGKLARFERISPGQTILLDAADGRYGDRLGWSPSSKTPVVPMSRPEETRLNEVAASEDEDDESQSAIPSASGWQTIADHGLDVARRARTFARRLGLSAQVQRLLDLAARWHDAGKAHPVFQDAIRRDAAGDFATARDLAKAPATQWRQPPYPNRSGFRHELASTLALFELLRRAEPSHPALLGGAREMLDVAGIAAIAVPEAERVMTDLPLAAELLELSPSEFDLVAWLVCSHHGKVRVSWSPTPRDQERGDGGIYGVLEERLPAVALADAGGDRRPMPTLELHLDCAAMGLNARYGASWVERVRGLVTERGPLEIAYFEALLRAADLLASRQLAERKV